MTRRHEGNISREGSRWRARLMFAGKRYSASFATRQEAVQWLRDLRRKLEHGVEVNERASLEDYLREWLGLKQQNVRATTLLRYEQLVRVHIVPALGRVRLQRLTAMQVERWCSDLVKGGVHPTTAKRAMDVLRNALNDAVRYGLLERNPAQFAKAPAQRKLEREWKIEHVQRIINATWGERVYPLLVVAFFTGLRQGELLGLKWEDIDWRNGLLHVRRQSVAERGQVVLREPKSASGVRVVSLPDEALRALQMQQIQVEAWRRRNDWQEHGLVFPSQRGTVWDANNVRKHFARVRERAGVPKTFTFHDIRHVHASVLIARGAPVKAVADRLGHADPQVTLRTYAHTLPEIHEELRRLASGVIEFAENLPSEGENEWSRRGDSNP